MQRRTFLAASAASMALLGSACAQQRRQRDPVPRTDEATGAFTDDTWTDISRSRPIPVRVRVPTTPGPWPVILFSHGLGGSRAGGALWGEAWAQAGFMTVHLQHAGSDTDAVMDNFRAAMSPAQLTARVLDVRFVLDELARRKKLPDSVFRNADLEAIGMSGHSFGAHTTLALAGQDYGAATPPPETRLKAFIAFSPSDSERPSAFARLRAPLLFITGTEDGDVVGTGATPQSRQQPFEKSPAGNKYLLVLDGADHMTFGGQTNLPRRMARRRPELAVAREAQHQTLVQTLTTTYWRAMLKGEEQARTMLTNPASVKAPDVWKTK
ncbi:MAG: alpha/beta hydrolase family protein [Burkholderiaceae bacterium]